MCPAWFADSFGWMGTAFRSRVAVPTNGGVYLGWRYNFDATPHSIPPYCGHATKGGTERVNKCEQLKACQDPRGADFYMTLAGGWSNERCDLASSDVGGDGYWCHHKPLASETGPTAVCAVRVGAAPADNPFANPRCATVDVKP